MRALVTLLCALVLTVAPARALAQVDDARRVALALARAGAELYQAGDFAGAYEQFRAAEQRLHAPTHFLWMARAQRERGKLVEARALFRSVIDEELGPAASAPFVQAQRQAQDELVALEPRLAWLTVTVRGSAAARASVFVDGIAVPPAEIGVAMAVDPGPHSASASAPGAEPVTRTVQPGEGAALTVELEIGPSAPPPVPPAPPLPPTAHATAPPSPLAPPDEGTPVPGAVLLGAGGAALVVAVATGVQHLRDVDALEERCGGTSCPPSEREAADRSTVLAHVSTTSLVLAGALAAAGTVLVIARPGETSAALRIRVDGVTLGGTF